MDLVLEFSIQIAVMFLRITKASENLWTNAEAQLSTDATTAHATTKWS
jgi:hypothetical protein